MFKQLEEKNVLFPGSTLEKAHIVSHIRKKGVMISVSFHKQGQPVRKASNSADKFTVGIYLIHLCHTYMTT